MKYLRPASALLLLFLIGTGVVFPLFITFVANFAFPYQAHGSLLKLDGKIVGSELIGQNFTDPKYFHPRPSANNYDAENSGGTNLGPTNPQLLVGAKDFDGIQQLAALYRKENGLSADTIIPADAVTRSGSGLDPNISVRNALLQAKRVAATRGLPLSAVTSLIGRSTVQKFLGIYGGKYVNVLDLNLAIDKLDGHEGSKTQEH